MVMQHYSGKFTQRGSASVELALTGLFFFVLMLAVIETGRAMYTWNALAEATRLGARAASVCQVQDEVVASIATFNGSGLLADLKPENIVVNYLDENGGAVANPTPANAWGFMQVRYIQVSIQGFNYAMLIPGIGGITLPTFSTIVPRESMGIVPDEAPGC